LIASSAACHGTTEVWDGNMNVAKDAMPLLILFGEEDRFEGSPLYEAIVQKGNTADPAIAHGRPRLDSAAGVGAVFR
jgi:hypothetical protein